MENLCATCIHYHGFESICDVSGEHVGYWWGCETGFSPREKTGKHGRWENNGPNDDVVYCNQCMMPQDMPTTYCHHCFAEMEDYYAERI